MAGGDGPVWTVLGVVKFGILIHGVGGCWELVVHGGIPAIPVLCQEMHGDQEFKVLVICIGMLRPAWAIRVFSHNKTKQTTEKKKGKMPVIRNDKLET